MSQSRTSNADGQDAPADQQAAADQSVRADAAGAEKRATNHRNQIRSVAHAAVQAMVNSHRAK